MLAASSPGPNLYVDGDSREATVNVYRTEAGLRHHLRDVLNFYYPACIDTDVGGYVAQLDERDGHAYDTRTRHLVATARGVANFSLGVLADGPDWCRFAAEHGLGFLSAAHWDPENEGYDWLLDGRETIDATRYCYGHAFVLLAGARAHRADIHGGYAALKRAYDVMEDHFWEPENELYADEASADWDELSAYRGQNANMHACEALIAAYAATDQEKYLDRAYTVAETFTRTVTRATDGLLWEHYTEEWEPDLQYNRASPHHRFRPWGYQPGHHLEWAKLLVLLHEHRPREWLVERARELFESAVGLGWDEVHEGFYYTIERSGEPVVADKYGWVHAEAIGASALLSAHDESYLKWYDKVWLYAREHLINPKYGNWYERLTREHEHDDSNRGVAVEPGYHPLTNCWLAMGALSDESV